MVFSDNGKRSLFYFRDTEGVTFDYTNRRYLKYSKRLKYGKKILREKKRYHDASGRSIVEIETELSKYCSRSSNSAKLKEYIGKVLEHEDAVHCYSSLKFRKLRWYGYISRQRTEAKLVNEIRSRYGKDAVLVMGDASIGVSMRYFISTPNIRLKRMLKNYFIVLELDEYRTSCINYRTLEYYTKNYEYLDLKGVVRKLHSVLVYQTLNEIKTAGGMQRLRTSGVINRDNNAVENIKNICHHYLRYNKGFEEHSRPWVFRRDVSSAEIKTGSNRSRQGEMHQSPGVSGQ